MIVKLNEYILSTENYKNYFYLVLRLNEDTLKNLLKMKLKGLKGISNSINIVNSYFDVRDILLVMDKDDAKKLNKIEEINYDDIEYLTKDNLSVLKRLYQVDDNYSISSLLYQMIIKSERFYKNTASHELLQLNNIKNKKLYSQYKRLLHDIYKINKNIKYINNYNELLEICYETLKDSYKKEDLDILLRFCILGFSNLFKGEGEVLIKEKYFTIPKDSYLFIKEQNIHSFKYEEKEKLMSTYLNKLKMKYKIKMLPYISGKYISNTHKPIFSIIRYLNKLKTYV